MVTEEEIELYRQIDLKREVHIIIHEINKEPVCLSCVKKAINNIKPGE